MHKIVLLATIVVVGADYHVDCDGIIFRGVYYEKEPIIKNINKPYNLFLHKFSGMLFFSHTVKNGTHVDFSIATCHVDTKQCSEVSGIPGGYAIAYDQGNDDIYLGGHDGIYKYNFLTTTAEFFAEEGHSVWGMFVGKNFYYIRYPKQKLYVYRGENFIQVAEAFYIQIDNFHVAKNNDLYFSNKTALYKVDYTHKNTIVLNDEISVKQIVEDNYGDVYFCAPGGIYIEDTPFNAIKKVLRADQAYGMTFDENEQVIYSDHEGIYRLQPSKHEKECSRLLYQPLQEHEISEHHRFRKAR